MNFHWPLYTWNKVQNGGKVAKKEYQARRWDFQGVREKATYDTILAYWTIASAMEAKRRLEVTIHELSLFHETAKADLARGASNAPEKDVIQIQVDLLKMKAWRGTLEKWLGASSQGLAIAIGQPAEPISIVDDKVRYKKFDMTFEDCLNAAYRQRSDLHALNERIKAAELMVKIHEKQNWPTVLVAGMGRFEDDGFDPSMNTIGMLGVFLNGTLYDGSKASSKANQARAQYRQAVRGKYGLQAMIRMQVKERYLSVKEAFLQLSDFIEAQRQVKKKLDIVRQGYFLELTDVEDVLNVQVERRFRDRDVIFTKLNLMMALAGLNTACGTQLYNFDK
jgi:outer membrane protein TolC